MCAYMERASFGALSSFMYPLLCRFMHDLFLFLFFYLASRKNGGKKNLFISNYHRSDVAFMLRVSMRVFLRQLARHLMPVRLFLRSLDNPIYRSIGKRSGISAAPLRSLLFSSRGCFRELQPLFRRIVGLHRLGLNNHACVAFLPCLASGGDCPCHVARTQPQRNRHACHDGGSHCCYHFINLLFSHNNLTV